MFLLSVTDIIWICVGVAAALAAPTPILLWYLGKNLYLGWFVRTKPTKYQRACSSAGDPIQMEEYNDGMAFLGSKKSLSEDVSITNEGFHLAGIYLNYGRKKTVIIIPGRGETVNYSAYFAEIYDQSSFNVLLIDQRACGLSDGKYLTAGITESSDLNAWARYLHDERKQELVAYHGVCIGGACAIMALAKEDCPSYVAGAFVEGPFLNFEKMFYMHTKALHHPTWPATQEVTYWFKKMAGVDIKKDCPEHSVGKVRQSMLFLQGKLDQYVPYQDAQTLYDACPSADKTLVYYEKGTHSRLRYYNRPDYDRLALSYFERLHL